MTQPSSRRTTKDTPQSSKELLATLLLHGVHLGSPLTLAQEWPVVVKRSSSSTRCSPRQDTRNKGEEKVVPAMNMHDNREQLDLVSSRAPQFCFCNPLPNFGRKLNPPHTPLLRSAASATSLMYAYDQNNRWPAPAEPSASSGSHHVHARACSPDFTTVLYEYLDLECTSITPYQAHLNTEVSNCLDTPAVTEFVVARWRATTRSSPCCRPRICSQTPRPTETTPSQWSRSSPSPSSVCTRIDSTPPSLPEITVQSRIFVASTYFSDAGSNSPFTPGLPEQPRPQTVGQPLPRLAQPAREWLRHAVAACVPGRVRITKYMCVRLTSSWGLSWLPGRPGSSLEVVRNQLAHSFLHAAASLQRHVSGGSRPAGDHLSVSRARRLIGTLFQLQLEPPPEWALRCPLGSRITDNCHRVPIWLETFDNCSSALAMHDADAAEDAYFNLQPHIENPGSVYVFLQQNKRVIGLLPTYPAGTERRLWTLDAMVIGANVKTFINTYCIFDFGPCTRNAPSFLVSNAGGDTASFAENKRRAGWRVRNLFNVHVTRHLFEIWPMVYRREHLDTVLTCRTSRTYVVSGSVQGTVFREVICSTSGRRKLFADDIQEQAFIVKGGLVWFHHVLIAAVEVSKSF
ncbi:hypothetical protein B0H17DRAFT_1141312 [Mycena rosella]|uniref:Uncharacterized protein n=1 Tax=Mycena rosella TaxID=1033263 RepID=A0AAD7G974_MYCRO|nr:hypothetical protein B0H17DRAFT_1141312 [Mycena rosella]